MLGKATLYYSTRAQQSAAHKMLVSRDILQKEVRIMTLRRTRGFYDWVCKVEKPDAAQTKAQTQELVALMMKRAAGYDLDEELVESVDVETEETVENEISGDGEGGDADGNGGSDGEGESGEGGESSEESDDSSDDDYLEDDAVVDNALVEEEDIDDEKPKDAEQSQQTRAEWLKEVSEASDSDIASPRTTELLSVCDTIRSGDAGARIVIFSKMLKFLDLINEQMVRCRQVKCHWMNGTCDSEERKLAIEEFGQMSGSILLMTPMTGDVGLNVLQVACHLIQTEPWWTVTEEQQAYGRLFRLEQRRVVTIHYLQALDSAIDYYVEGVRAAKKEIRPPHHGPSTPH